MGAVPATATKSPTVYSTLNLNQEPLDFLQAENYLKMRPCRSVPDKISHVNRHGFDQFAASFGAQGKIDQIPLQA